MGGVFELFPANVLFQLTNQFRLFRDGLLDQVANRQQTDQLPSSTTGKWRRRLSDMMPRQVSTV